MGAIKEIERFCRERQLDKQEFDEDVLVTNLLEEIGELMGYYNLPKDQSAVGYGSIIDLMRTVFGSASDWRQPTKEEQVDALTDKRVFLIDATMKLGYKPACALKEVGKEINSRKQDKEQKALWAASGPEGKWQKQADQPKDTLYKADFTHCEYT